MRLDFVSERHCFQCFPSCFSDFNYCNMFFFSYFACALLNFEYSNFIFVCTILYHGAYLQVLGLGILQCLLNFLSFEFQTYDTLNRDSSNIVRVLFRFILNIFHLSALDRDLDRWHTLPDTEVCDGCIYTMPLLRFSCFIALAGVCHGLPSGDRLHDRFPFYNGCRYVTCYQGSAHRGVGTPQGKFQK